jgi:hypothetical protein
MSVAPTDCSLDDRPIQRRNDVICFGAPITESSATRLRLMFGCKFTLALAICAHLSLQKLQSSGTRDFRVPSDRFLKLRQKLCGSERATPERLPFLSKIEQ